MKRKSRLLVNLVNTQTRLGLCVVSHLFYSDVNQQHFSMTQRMLNNSAALSAFWYDDQ